MPGGDEALKQKIKMLALLMSVLMFCTIFPQPLDAAQTVYFTSVDDMLMDLNDETMPFWQGSTLYVASMVFDRSKSSLGTGFSISRDKTVAIIYKSREVLYCDLKEGTIENNSTHEILPGNVILRGDVVFFPVATVARFFGFDYSCVKVDSGYLVRVKSANTVLTDTSFIDAATAPMQQRYNQYQKAHTPVEDPQNSENENEAENKNENENENTMKDGVVQLVISVSDETAAEQVLSTFSSRNSSATFLLSEQEILEMPDLVRHIIVSGNTIALEIGDVTENGAVVDAIEQANDALWTVSNTKTRLVFLTDIGAGKEAAVGAGYCPITAELDFRGNLPTSARINTRISSIIVRSGRCTACLGEDSSVQNVLSGTLSLLRNNGCRVLRMNEIAA